MGSNLYFLSGTQAHSMHEYKYELEADLQKLVANNPHLILRDQEKELATLMLVDREYGIWESETGSNTFSLDGLFLDQSGVPVLVEVKRSSDTRIKREVVGQLIDYAARARTWNLEHIQNRFRENVSDELKEIYDTDDFWQRVSSNLRAEHIRMVFVADTIPDSLRIMIDFLDRNMQSIEVYGVEIRQYKTEDNTTMLTSNIIEGVIASEKAAPKGIAWDTDSFIKYLIEHNLNDAKIAADNLLGSASNLGLTYYFGRGAKYPTVTFKLGKYKLFVIEAYEYFDGLKCPIAFDMREMAKALDDSWTEDKLRKELTNIPDCEYGRKKKLLWETPQYVYMDLSLLRRPENMEAFKDSIHTICNPVEPCSMLGAIVGDIVGSIYEFDNHRSKEFPLFSANCFATDDSIMTLAVAKALVEWKQGAGELDDLAVRYMQEVGRPYPGCGYGGRFRGWMYSDDPEPYNSFGNGAAMRVSPVAYVAGSLEEVKALSKAVTGVTHNHPEGLKGAEATAVATWMALHGASKEKIGEHIRENYYDIAFTLDEIRPVYQFNETCQDTVPQAIEAFLESEDFEDAIRNAISVGGDSDTLAAITGAIAGAYYGIPQGIANQAQSYLDNRLKSILHDFGAAEL